MSIVETVAPVRLTLLRQVALLINRELSATSFLSHSDKAIALELLKNLLAQISISLSHIRTAFWIAKALVLRLDNIGTIIPLLIDSLRRKDYGLHVARGFAILLAPDEILSSEHGAIIRKLAKQRVLTLCVANISAYIRQAEAATKSNYLIALSGVLQYVSNDVMATELETLLPLLLQSLDLENISVRAATIESLTVMVRTNPTLVAEHAASLITKLLKASSDPQYNAKIIRLNALRCLGSFPGRMSESTLLPFRGKVTYGLRQALDDRRRDVRVEAIDCKANWNKLDEPDDD